MNESASPATWYLVAGKTGAGKSTFARELCNKYGAVHFSIDEWMSTLFWADLPAKNDYGWAIERVQRCEEQMAKMAQRLAMQGISSVLDLGFTQREQRAQWRTRAAAAGARAELHVMDQPTEIRWQRVCERNLGASETFSFQVTREMFDFMEKIWEPVTVEELALL